MTRASNSASRWRSSGRRSSRRCTASDRPPLPAHPVHRSILMKNLSYTGEEILETIQMVRTEQLDIRTITIGISLLDCVSDTTEGLCAKVYEKVTGKARDLRKV